MSERSLRRVLRQHVQTDQLLGVEVVPRGQISPAPVPAPAAATGPADDGRRFAQRDFSSGARTESPTMPRRSTAPRPTAGNTKLPVITGRLGPLTREQKAAMLAELDEQYVRTCRQCVLHQVRTQTVFGEGNPDAQLMFVGEGPGETEDQTGRPFVGRAGELLDKQIAAMNLRREDVFIANVVKCRPPNNRTPSPDETQTCYPFLLRQIQIIAPRVIVTLGGPAMKTLLGTTMGITTLRGAWHEFTGLSPEGPVIPVMPTFHPAYLLRVYTVENRKKVWSDLQKVMELLAEN